MPDSHIILMIADEMACNARNPRPATIFDNAAEKTNLYGDTVEVDYGGYEVTVENFIRLLTGRHVPGTVPSKRLLTDDQSNILIYITGHGGDGFVKFQDNEEVSSQELADAFEQMWQKRRYREILFIVDSCQAYSMALPVYSPNILALGSSRVGEDSLSHHVDPKLGVYVADRYSYYLLQFLEKVGPTSRHTLADFLGVCPYHECLSHVTAKLDLYNRDPAQVSVLEFFGSRRSVEILDDAANFTAAPDVSAAADAAYASASTASHPVYLAYKPLFPF
ncbi:hypothetical protein BOX15_Mlig008567g5 [Macrostomum lignano]|uniref:GPI-anchor transamidase n=1 Tax=Macrostomum lignano TaxID=282301 RepID=A0A267GDP4_9PLAT|nr:hypothetical protein BOX15_Mlig008567g5 [Macrostomum lignano]